MPEIYELRFHHKGTTTTMTTNKKSVILQLGSGEDHTFKKAEAVSGKYVAPLNLVLIDDKYIILCKYNTPLNANIKLSIVHAII